jgi:hypothetical protein
MTPTVNVTGDWQGEWRCDNDPAHPGVVVLTLTQTGAAVKGHATVTNAAVNRTGYVEGNVSGDAFRVTSPEISVDTTVSGNTMAVVTPYRDTSEALGPA